MTGKEFVELLERRGFDFFTGVPCSLFEGTFNVLDRHPRLPYLPAIREDAALGLAAGAWFGGRTPAVLMQNSGLGTSLNGLASLSLMYKLPALLVVSWRGFGGKDAPEHILMGEISPRLLDLLGIAHQTLSPATVEDDLAWAEREMKKRMEPVALLLPPKLMDPGKEARDGGPGFAGTENALPGPAASVRPPTLSRAEAIAQVVPLLTNEPVIHANGFICRESFGIKDRPENFYMIGSMGLASAIGFGLALTRDRTVVVFDGDGNLLMNLGILAMVGASRPRNFVHFVFDNGVYGSTGNQRSLSQGVRLDRLAEVAGYRRSFFVSDARELREAARRALNEDGPTFVLAKVTAAETPVPRIPYPPEEIRDRFLKAVKSEA